MSKMVDLIRQGTALPSTRRIKGVLYELTDMSPFKGDIDRRKKGLQQAGYKVRVFTERYVGDNTGVWVLYRSIKG